MLCTGNRDGLRTLLPVPERSDRGPDAREVAITERAGVPAGLDHKTEEQQALGVLEAMESHTITMHGQTVRRSVRHFGPDYGYESWTLVSTDPLPDDPAWLQKQAAALAGLDPDQFVQLLVSSYPPGSPPATSAPTWHWWPAMELA